MPPNPPTKRLVVFAAHELDPVVQQICQATSRLHGFETLMLNGIDELAPILDGNTCVVVLRGIRSTEQLREQLSFTREYRRNIADRELIPLAATWLGHRQVVTILRKMGFSDVISLSALRPETCRTRLLAVFEEIKARLDSPPDELREAIAFDDPKEGRIATRENRLILAEPVELKENCWLLRSPEDIRRVRGHWVVDMAGPGPSSGRWIIRDRSTLIPSTGHALWEWKPKSGGGGEGSWIFAGKRPRFIDYHWSFISQKPELVFIEGTSGRKIGEIFKVDESSRLVVAMNSDSAARKWPEIHASILGEMKIHKPAEVIQTLQVRFDAGKAGDPWREAFGVTETEEKQVFQRRAEVYASIEQHFVPRPQLFNPVRKDALRAAYLKELRERKLQVLIWTAGQTARFEVPVLGVLSEPDSIRIPLPARVDPGLMQGQLFACVSLVRGGLFFSVAQEHYRLENGELILELPVELYEVQRRKQFRLTLPADQGIFLRVEEAFYPAVTLSAGGLGFLADSKDYSRFAVGTVFKDIGFELNAARIRCGMEVRWLKVINGTSGADLTVGVKFLDLHPKDRQRIHVFVLEAGYESFKRFVLDVPEDRE